MGTDGTGSAAGGGDVHGGEEAEAARWRPTAPEPREGVSCLSAPGVASRAAYSFLPGTPEGKALAAELKVYEIRVDQAGHARFGAFLSGTHDELVTALGLAVGGREGCLRAHGSPWLSRGAPSGLGGSQGGMHLEVNGVENRPGTTHLARGGKCCVRASPSPMHSLVACPRRSACWRFLAERIVGRRPW